MPHIRRHAIRRGNAPLHVTNRRGSPGVESLSSGAPPCYTSQRGVGSSIAASDDGVQSLNPSDDNESVSMHSCAEIAAQEILPSPYSTEDLFADSHGVDDHTFPAAPSSTHTQSCAHGYTHTHSQCTIDMPPAVYDPSHLQPATQNNPFPNSQASSPSPYMHPGRHARYSSTPTTPNVSQQQHRALRRASDATSPRSILYHHRPASQPAAIGQLPPQRPFKGYELHHLDPSDQFTSSGENVTPIGTPQIHTPTGESTITFLQEDPYATPVNYRSANHRRAYSSLSTSYIPAPPSSTASHHPTKSRATNYVSLSRKSTYKKAPFFGRKPASSSITGNFTIDPSLHIPNALLKAVEPRSHSLADLSRSKIDVIASESLRLKQSSKVRPRSNDDNVNGPKTRRKNLILEVENGGIDVDVHLVPTSLNNNNTLTRHTSSTGDFVGRRSVDNHNQDNQLRTSFTRRPSSRRSQALEYDSSTEPNAAPPITSIDLKLKTDPRSRRGKTFPLVARIASLLALISHAPCPRPSFHLLASTIALESAESPSSSLENSDDSKINEARLPIPAPPSNSVSTSSPDTPPSQSPPNNDTKTKPTVTRVKKNGGALIRKPLSKSHMTIHLPRSFKGPLTVHVAAGNIDDHVRLSKAVADAAVVLSEGAFSRGYYLGGLSSSSSGDDETGDEDESPEEDAGGFFSSQVSEHTNRTERDNRRRPTDDDGPERGLDDEIYRESRLNNPTQLDDEVDEDAEWMGDKADVVVGEGKVYLQFLEEEDPFGKQGRFWRKWFFCR